MPRYVISERARSDLVSIWEYIASDNVDAADQMLARIEHRCRLLGEFPESGEMRSDLGTELRQAIVGQYVVFYRAREDDVDIVRALHGSRDIPQELRRHRT